MRATRNKITNTVLSAPDGWDEIADGECVDLPIAQAHGVMFSYWRPTLIDRLRVAFGGHIRLGVYGERHPPVSIDTLS